MEWSSFVTRCVRSWIAAGASATEFLATWTPLALPAAAPRTPARPQRSRRRPSGPARRIGRRAANRPRAHAVGVPWTEPLAVLGSAAALRGRYPLVSALLIELSRAQRRRPVSNTLHRA